MKHAIENLEKKSYQYRKRFLELFTQLGFGHVTTAFSWTEIANVLYNEILENAGNISSMDKDKMVVSKGHGAGMLFPIFEDKGFFSEEEMNQIIKIGGDNRKLKKLFYPGFDFYGGSLGIGLGVAVGIAKADKLSKNQWNTYCIVGDAESYEGAIWEAVGFAAHNCLDNLIVIIDRNMLGCSDFTENMIKFEPLKEKWIAFNWDVQEVNGHDIQEVYNALYYAKMTKKNKPHCIIANTKKGNGLDYLIDKPLMHGYMPKGDEIAKAFKELR